MDGIFSLLTPQALALAFGITLVAGVVKGLVGFAMPMIMISGLSLFMPPQVALAALILPTLVGNGWQALRQGPAAALETIRRFWFFLVVGAVALIIGAQLVRVLPQPVLFALIGGPVAIFAFLQLVGWRPRIDAPSRRVEAVAAILAGFVGGLSGIWGPPTVAYLTALDTEKADHIRAQGVIYGLASAVLLAAHLQSGVMRAETAPLSALMLLPAIGGMAIGQRFHDRIDQATFRKATLFVLLIAGLNLLRRAF